MPFKLSKPVGIATAPRLPAFAVTGKLRSLHYIWKSPLFKATFRKPMELE
jgi:hypothetical protein